MEADLTDDEFGPAILAAFTERRYAIARTREWMRGILAILLVLALVGVLAAAAVIWAFHIDRIDDVQKFLSASLAPLVALVGAVTGFYFGEKAAQRGSTE
jgi:cell shape-determining protein MreD